MDVQRYRFMSPKLSCPQCIKPLQEDLLGLAELKQSHQRLKATKKTKCHSNGIVCQICEIVDKNCAFVNRYPEIEKLNPKKEPKTSFLKCSDPHDSLKMLNKFLSKELTAKMKERVAAILHCYLKSVGDSFSTRDLVLIGEMLPQLLLKDAETENYYKTYISRLLLKARNTPVYELCSCEMTKNNLRSILKFYLIKLSESLTCKENNFYQHEIAQVFYNLVALPGQNGKEVGFEHVLHCLEEDTVLEAISEIFASSPLHVYVSLLNFMLIASTKSQAIACYFIKTGCIDIILIRISPDSNISMTSKNIVTVVMKYRKFVDLNNTFLDLLLSNYDPTKFDNIRISTKAIDGLTKMINQANETDGYLFTKKMRNQLLCLFVKLQRLFPENGVREAVNRLGLSPKIVFIESFLNIKNVKGDHCSKINLNGEDDKDFAKLLLLSQFYILQSKVNLSDDEKFHLAKQCVPNMMKDGQLLQYCFNLGRQFVPYLKTEFLSIGNCKKLLNMLDKFIKLHYRGRILIEVLKTLDFITNIEDNGNILKYLKENDTIFLICTLLSKILNESILEKSDKISSIHAIKSMISLVERDVDAQKKYFEEIVNIFVESAKKVHIQSTFGTSFDYQLLSYSIALVAKLVVQNNESSKKFIEKGLIYNLMDLLSLNDNTITGFVLQILTDLCEDHPKALAFLLTWREPTSGICFRSKVCDIWRDHEQLEEVLRDPNGIIEDLDYPLMGKHQRDYQGNIRINSSPSLLEATFGIRTKIYAVVEMIRDDAENVTDVYNIGNSLNVKDQITLVLIENYLILKQQELWQEITHTFRAHGIVLHDASGELLRVLTGINRQAVETIRDRQLAILNYHEILHEKLEETSYKLGNECNSF